MFNSGVKGVMSDASLITLLSVGMAFYCRVFMEVCDDKAGVSEEEE